MVGTEPNRSTTLNRSTVIAVTASVAAYVLVEYAGRLISNDGHQLGLYWVVTSFVLGAVAIMISRLVFHISMWPTIIGLCLAAIAFAIDDLRFNVMPLRFLPLIAGLLLGSVLADMKSPLAKTRNR